MMSSVLLSGTSAVVFISTTNKHLRGQNVLDIHDSYRCQSLVFKTLTSCDVQWFAGQLSKRNRQQTAGDITM